MMASATPEAPTLRKRLMAIAFTAFGMVRTNPREFYRLLKAFFKGLLYVLFCRLFRRNVQIRLPFLVYCKRIVISGPGSVFIDKGCSIFTNSFDRLAIITLSPYAHVRIGKKCDLGGVTVRCHERVELGDQVLAANCLVQDFPILTDRSCRPNVAEIDRSRASGILIGKNVWLAGQTIVLHGSTIGDGAVLSQGSVCCNFVVPKNHFAVGNPVYRSMSLDVINNVLRSP